MNALIRSVGLTPDGAMGVPSNRFDVAWYNRGPRPGESGSAVIDGHIGFKGGTVFDQLHTLQKGDRLSTVDSQGEVKTFVVRETRIYNFDANVPEVFVSGDGGSHLNLVTCTGVWNKLQKRYNKRLVVFTDLVK